MPAEDVHATRMVQRELIKRGIDISYMDVRVSHGVVYLRGIVRKMRGMDFDLEREMAIICNILRQKPGIRQVVNDCVIRQ